MEEITNEQRNAMHIAAIRTLTKSVTKSKKTALAFLVSIGAIEKEERQPSSNKKAGR